MTITTGVRTAIAALALGLAAGAAWAEVPADKVPLGRITVTGEGAVSAAPDMANVTLGVTTEARTASAAMAENTKHLTRVFDELKAAGITARDMQSSGLSLGPQWSRISSTNKERHIVGFVASNRVTVRVRKLDTLGAVLDALVRAGANNINGLNFSVANPKPLQDEARSAAVKDARHRAELMAEAAGVKLGPVISISEAGAPMPRPMMRAAVAVAESAPVPVAAGEMDLTARVTMVYAIDQ